jgi:hypothetical protein
MTLTIDIGSLFIGVVIGCIFVYFITMMTGWR